MSTKSQLVPANSTGNGQTAVTTSSECRLPSMLRPNWLPHNVWPFQSAELVVDGCTIAVTETGQGPIILLVHTGMWSFIWRDVILRLARDFRCICFDAPGTGQSDHLPVRSIRLEKAARAVTAVIEALNLDDITLIFHDLGGPASIAGAARVPNRIRGLCAVNAFAWKPSGTFFRSMLALIGSSPVREFDAFTQLIPAITSSAFGVGRHLDQASRRAFLAGIGREGTRAFHCYLRDARRADAIYEEAQDALMGPFRTLPLLTIFGERNDPLGFQPRWKRLFPTVWQVVVAKGNHFPMCDDPDLVAASIREFYADRVARP